MSVRTAIARTAPAAVLALAFVAVGVGASGSASTVTNSPSNFNRVSWSLYGHYATQIICIGNIAPAILKTHADDAVCVKGSFNGWDLLLDFG